MVWDDLAKQGSVSKVMVSRDKRGEAVPFIEATKKIASPLGVTLATLPVRPVPQPRPSDGGKDTGYRTA